MSNLLAAAGILPCIALYYVSREDISKCLSEDLGRSR